MTPLMLAASRSNMSNLVETFLNYEADPYAKDSRGFTALRWDIQYHRLRFCIGVYLNEIISIILCTWKFSWLFLESLFVGMQKSSIRHKMWIFWTNSSVIFKDVLQTTPTEMIQPFMVVTRITLKTNPFLQSAMHWMAAIMASMTILKPSITRSR